MSPSPEPEWLCRVSIGLRDILGDRGSTGTTRSNKAQEAQVPGAVTVEGPDCERVWSLGRVDQTRPDASAAEKSSEGCPGCLKRSNAESRVPFSMVYGTLERPRQPEGKARDETTAKSLPQRSSLTLNLKMLGLYGWWLGRK